MSRAEFGRERLAIHARELALQSRLRVTGSNPRHMQRGLDQAHPGTVDHNVHRNAGLGAWVLINENWYYRQNGFW